MRARETIGHQHKEQRMGNGEAMQLGSRNVHMVLTLAKNGHYVEGAVLSNAGFHITLNWN